MKKLTITTLVIAALCTLHNICNAMMPAAEPYKVYIENHYGAPIKFKAAQPQEAAPEISVGNMERVLVENTYPYMIKKLSIRTTGAGSSYFSPFTDLAKEVQRIHHQAHLEENLNKNAVIIIKPSKSYENWNIQINWEGKLNTEEMSPEDVIITGIMNGMWGSDCAQKVADISSYRFYDWANKLADKPNLNSLLFRYVNNFIIDNDRQKLISRINTLHKELNSYNDLFAVTK